MPKSCLGDALIVAKTRPTHCFSIPWVEFLTLQCIAGGGSQNPINHYFGYQIRNQRGRFTPGGSLLKKFFWNFDFLNIFKILTLFFIKSYCFYINQLWEYQNLISPWNYLIYDTGEMFFYWFLNVFFYILIFGGPRIFWKLKNKYQKL